VFRLLRLIFFLGCLAAFAWFGMTVPLGDRTLFEHIQAIWKTNASQDLLRGTKEKVGDLVDRATDKVVKGVARNAPSQVNSHGEGAGQEPGVTPPPPPPMEDLPAKDRKALRGLIGQGRPVHNE
jgi:hypothetical protein